MEQEKEIRRCYNRLGLGMLLYMLITQFFPIPLLLLARSMGLLETEWVSLLIQDGVQYLVALPAAAMVIRSIRNPRRPISAKMLSPKQFLSCALLGIGLMYLFNIVGNLINLMLAMVKGAPVANLVEQSVSTYSLWRGILLLVVLAPLAEEFLFRKLVYEAVGNYGEKAYLFTSACLFMLMHGNVVQYPYAFVLGLLFAGIYLRTGNIWNTILLHAAANFVGGILPMIGDQIPAVLYLLVVIYLTASIYAVRTAWIYRHLRVKNTPPLEDGALDAALLNPGMILFTAASFAMAGFVILYL